MNRSRIGAVYILLLRFSSRSFIIYRLVISLFKRCPLAYYRSMVFFRKVIFDIHYIFPNALRNNVRCDRSQLSRAARACVLCGPGGVLLLKKWFYIYKYCHVILFTVVYRCSTRQSMILLYVHCIIVSLFINN